MDMTTIRAHFDGKVFVPDEPVDLPVGEAVEVSVHQAPPTPETESLGDAILRFAKEQPTIDRGDLPTDGSINYKHYLYGHPKRS